MTKTYSPEEVRLAVLKRCQELVLEHNLNKKEQHEDEAQDKEVCEEVAEEEVKEHEDEMHKKGVKKSSHKLKNFLDKQSKKKALKKFMGAPAAAAPVGQSLASQIGWPNAKKSEIVKKEDAKDIKELPEIKKEKVEKCGETKVVKKVKKADKVAGMNAPKDPMGVTEKVKEPKADEAPPKPKAATTLKDFMAKRKK